MRMLRFAFFVFYFSLAHLQAQESGGIIAGEVLDEQGQPVADAQVCVGRTEVKDQHPQTLRQSCITSTDDTGQFQVENLSFTHGSSDQRVHWFQQGMTSGSLESCDTFTHQPAVFAGGAYSFEGPSSILKGDFV